MPTASSRRRRQKEKERAESDGDEPAAIPFLKRFTVFNVAQCDGLPEGLTVDAPPVPDNLILPEAETLIRATGASPHIAGERAFYSVGGDFVQVPPPQAFFEPINWHRTAFHELGHWTGHVSRLARDLSGSFGSKPYAREELVAEMTAAFVCAAMGIVPTVRHADYLGSWLDVLREDNRAIVRAASQASKAADFLLAFRTAPAAADAQGVVVDSAHDTPVPFETETTPEGEQSLVPGVRPLTDRDRLALLAARPLVPRVPQRPLDIGLFDEAARNQLSLF